MEKTSIQLDKNSQVRRARRLKFLFVSVLFLILIVAGIIGFLRKKQYQITSIEIAGTQALDEELVKKQTESFLKGNYFVVIPRTNALLISKSALREYLLDAIPSLNDARIDFASSNEMTVTVHEKKPKYVWCQESTCYFVDEQGVIYAESPTFSDGVFLKFKGGISFEDSPLKKMFVSRDKFMTTLGMVELLKKFPMEVAEVSFGTDTALRVTSIKGLVVGSNSNILISDKANESSIAQSIELIVNDKTFSTALATKGSSLEYVDLRFPGKIYYKFTQ